jgi:hypothetical protein
MIVVVLMGSMDTLRDYGICFIVPPASLAAPINVKTTCRYSSLLSQPGHKSFRGFAPPAMAEELDANIAALVSPASSLCMHRVLIGLFFSEV